MPRRRKPIGLFKNGVKHSGTILANAGAASPPAAQVVLKTSGGPRSTTGSPMTIQSLASTDEDCRTGDTVKYINLHLQCGPRAFPTVEDEEKNGWMEWAFICVRENENVLPITNAGTQTIGDIATQMYRGECVFTGSIPVGGQ